jgi:uncharacterized membrane protein YbhN (UPF0104 family)
MSHVAAREFARYMDTTIADRPLPVAGAATAVDEPAVQAAPERRGWKKVGKIVTIVVTLAGIGGLLGQVGSFGAIADALGDARWSWVLVALGVSALTFPVSAIGVRAGLRAPVTLGSVTALQAASKFANLVTPAGLGSTALNVRFLRRQGIDATSAIMSDVATSMVSGIAEIGLVLICVRSARHDLDIGGLPPGAGRIALLVLIAVGLVIAIASRIPRLRAAVLPHLRRAWDTVVAIVRSPRRTLTIAASAVATNLLFATCLALCLRAYGGDLPLLTIVVVNWAAATLAGASPVPGGLGVAEAGLVAGLTSAGTPSAIAVAAVLTHRLVTFWLPPVAGCFAVRHLQRRDLL